MTCNGDLVNWSAHLFSSALSLLAGHTAQSSLLMARYDPVKECAQDRTGQRISGNGSATCFGDADITYPVASGNSPPVDEQSWLTGHQAGDPSDSNTSGHFDSPASLPPTRGHHHRSYAPYQIPSTSTTVPPISRPQGRRGRLSAQSHRPSRPTTPLADGQEIPGSSWTPADFASPFSYPSYPPTQDWRHSPSMAETLQSPSIPSHSRVSSLPPLPVTQMDPAWQDVNSPSIGTTTQSASSSPRHSPFRDTPTPADQSGSGSKGRKRSRGRYRKEDPADRHLRESTEGGNRLWTCMWIEPSHGTPNSPAAQNVCGHQAPKSNARQHVKSRHLKLRPYICPECGRTWRDQGARYNHRVREHGYVPKKPKKWLDDDAIPEGGISSDASHLNVSFVMESMGH